MRGKRKMYRLYDVLYNKYVDGEFDRKGIAEYTKCTIQNVHKAIENSYIIGRRYRADEIFENDTEETIPVVAIEEKAIEEKTTEPIVDDDDSPVNVTKMDDQFCQEWDEITALFRKAYAELKVKKRKNEKWKWEFVKTKD